MHLDVPTLLFAGGLIGGMSFLILLTGWAYIRVERSLLWWAAATFAYTTAVVLITVDLGAPRPIVVLASLAIMNISPPLIWAGARSFSHRSIPWALFAAGPLIWAIMVALSPLVPHGRSAAMIAGLVVWIVYCLAAAWEFWRERAERLIARWPLITLLTIHAAVMVGGISDVVTGKLTTNGEPSFSGWFGIINIEGLFYFIGTALCIAAMAHQRREHGYVRAAETDSLTGFFTRGTFLERAHRLLQRCRHEASPLALLMFDLDRFKTINDTYGHAAGDEVIRAFSEVVHRTLRPNDVTGRYGGEEFAVILPGATLPAAYAIAERIRHNFAVAHVDIGSGTVSATTSGGAAVAADDMTIGNLIQAADRALYRAKNLGRNRIEQSHDADGASDDAIVRIA